MIELTTGGSKFMLWVSNNGCATVVTAPRGLWPRSGYLPIPLARTTDADAAALVADDEHG